MHLDDERIQRLLHGELDAAAKGAVTRHAAECDLCARALEDARLEEELVYGALSKVDHAAPGVSAEMIAARARGLALEDRAARRDARSRTSHASGWQRRAAALLIIVAAAGAAYAVPGSPLPALLDRIVALVTGSPRSSGQSESIDPGPSAPRSDQPVTSGIAFTPRERFAIQFTSRQERGAIAVTLTDSPSIAVRVIGGTATLGTDVDRLTIDNAGSTADYEIEVPKTAPWIAIDIGAERVLTKEGAKVTTDAATDASGRRILELAR